MTTIAATRNEIACDRQATIGTMKIKLETKIQRYENPIFYKVPFYVGLAGNLDEFSDIFGFLLDPSAFKKPPSGKGIEGLVLSADGKLWTFKSPVNWLSLNQPYYAMGSGSHFAMGAMASGKSPAEAVAVASKLDIMTGLGVKHYAFG